MAALKEILPPAKSSAATFYDHSSDPWFKQRYSASTEEEVANVVKTNPIPVYNTPERLKYRPSKPQDFGDGGAFPEIHYAQYPLDMGRKRDSNSGPKTLPVTVDDKGNLTFDAIVKQNENSRKIVYSQHRDIIPKILKDDEEEYEEDDEPRETKEEREERIQREKIREERRRERERERRLEAKDAAMGKKSKITRDRDRDISEKVALGMASAGSGRGGEVMYDQRLFNQEKGMESGFATDDQYNIYDKGLFTAQPTLSTLYRPKKDADDEMYGGADEQLEKIRKTDRFKPDKGFTGAGEKSGPRGGPVEFERDVVEDADPFGLDQFLTEVKGGKKPLDKIGSGGTMRASGGGSRDGYEGSGRTRIGFEKGR
ncbi:putative SKI-interacting protein, SKIP [Helianthus annuus]|nr:putative SKI-interacting protein, SKIP [Helianthus annuus]